MDNYVFIIFLLLIIAVGLTVVRKGEHLMKVKLLRIFITAGAILFFTFWFFRKSVPAFVTDSLAVQVINKLPQPLDIYVVKVRTGNVTERYQLLHSGKIRPDHYRIEYLKMENSDEFWIAGYLGKKNLVYFSQHAVPNKNMDQIIEIQNYINQSLKLSAVADQTVIKYREDDMQTSVWVTLSMLLIFFSIVLLLQKK